MRPPEGLIEAKPHQKRICGGKYIILVASDRGDSLRDVIKNKYVNKFGYQFGAPKPCAYWGFKRVDFCNKGLITQKVSLDSSTHITDKAPFCEDSAALESWSWTLPLTVCSKNVGISKDSHIFPPNFQNLYKNCPQYLNVHSETLHHRDSARGLEICVKNERTRVIFFENWVFPFLGFSVKFRCKFIEGKPTTQSTFVKAISKFSMCFSLTERPGC